MPNRKPPTRHVGLRLTEQERTLWQRLAEAEHISKRDVFVRWLYEQARQRGWTVPADDQPAAE